MTRADPIRIDKEVLYCVDDGSFTLRVSQERAYTLRLFQTSSFQGLGR